MSVLKWKWLSLFVDWTRGHWYNNYQNTLIPRRCHHTCVAYTIKSTSSKLRERWACHAATELPQGDSVCQHLQSRKGRHYSKIDDIGKEANRAKKCNTHTHTRTLGDLASLFDLRQSGTNTSLDSSRCTTSNFSLRLLESPLQTTYFSSAQNRDVRAPTPHPFWSRLWPCSSAHG